MIDQQAPGGNASVVSTTDHAGANLAARRAKLLADSPILMRLRELEVLEKVATTGNLNVAIGEKGLADPVVNLL